MDGTNMSAAQFEALGASLSDGKQPGDTVRWWHYLANGGMEEHVVEVLHRSTCYVQVRFDNNATRWLHVSEVCRY